MVRLIRIVIICFFVKEFTKSSGGVSVFPFTEDITAGVVFICPGFAGGLVVLTGKLVKGVILI